MRRMWCWSNCLQACAALQCAACRITLRIRCDGTTRDRLAKIVCTRPGWRRSACHRPAPALPLLRLSGPVTVRRVQECLNQARPTGYTTVLKLMQIMAEKGLVGDVDYDARLYTPITVVFQK